MSFLGRAVRSLMGKEQEPVPPTNLSGTHHKIHNRPEGQHAPTLQNSTTQPIKPQTPITPIKLDKKILEKITELKKLWAKYVSINEEAERSLLLYKILPSFNSIFQTMDTKLLSES